MSPAERGAGMCENQLLSCPSFVIEPSVLLSLPSLYLSYLTRASVCRINTTFPSRRCVEHGEKKKIKKKKMQSCQDA